MAAHAERLSQEAVDYLKDAANYYRFLSRLFYKELDESLIQDLVQTQKTIELTDDLDETERNFVLGNNKMVRFLERRTPDTLTQSRCDYARVFLGAGQTQENPVSPFESVYTSEDQLLMQGARDDVYRVFRSERLALEDEYNMPEDHLAFELQYLAHVAQEVVQMAESRDTAQAETRFQAYLSFFENHVANWVTRFCDEAAALAKTPFYQGLAQCTKAWVLMEGELWGVEVASAFDSAGEFAA